MIERDLAELEQWLEELVQISEYTPPDFELNSDDGYEKMFEAIRLDHAGRKGVIECRAAAFLARKCLLEEARLVALPKNDPEREWDQIKVLRFVTKESITKALRAQTQVLASTCELRKLTPLKKYSKRGRPKGDGNRHWLLAVLRLRREHPGMTIYEAGKNAGRCGTKAALDAAYRDALKKNPDLNPK